MRKTILSLLMGFSLTMAAQTPVTAPKGDPAQRAEKMFNFLLNDQADSLYANFTLQLKPILSKEQLSGVVKRVEENSGKYKSHGTWEIKDMPGGSKSCTTLVQFDKEELGALVIFDPSGFLLGIQIVPAKAIKQGSNEQ